MAQLKGSYENLIFAFLCTSLAYSPHEDMNVL